MLATVYFLYLTEEQRNEINNGGGWSTSIGQRYLAAKDGAIAENLDLFEIAAVGDFSSDENCWLSLQNIDEGWAQGARPTGVFKSPRCLTDFPRSMDVGDFIVWADGRRQRCASFGFEPVGQTTVSVEGAEHT